MWVLKRKDQVPPGSFLDANQSWQDLGVYTITSNSLVVSVSDNADGNVLADAIRVERVGYPGRVSDDGDVNVGDFIEDKSAANPAECTSHSLLKERLDAVLTTLSERERKILEMRFGLVDGYGHTLEEIGNLYNVTRERIRQIEAKSLRKLRHPTRAQHLHGFLETRLEFREAPGFSRQ